MLRIVRPAIHTDRNDREAAARASMVRAGRTFLGVKGVRSQRASDRPNNAEPRRGLSPRIAARNKWQRIEALRRLKRFVSAYREAYEM